MISVLNGHRHRRACLWAAVLTMNVVRAQPQAPTWTTIVACVSNKPEIWRARREAYEAALKIAPQRIDALSNVGLVYGGLHQYDRAIQSFEKALAVDPRQPAVLFNLGLIYLQAGKSEDARRTLSLVAGIQPDNAAAHHYLGVSLLKLGRLQEGISQLEIASHLHPPPPGMIWKYSTRWPPPISKTTSSKRPTA